MEKLEGILWVKPGDFEGSLREVLQEYYDIEIISKTGTGTLKVKFPPAATEGILMQPGVVYLEFFNPAYNRNVLLHGWSSRQVYNGILKTDGKFEPQAFKSKIPKLYRMEKDGDNTFRIQFPAITKELILKQPGVVSLTYKHGGTAIKELGETSDDATAKMMEELGLSQWGVSLPKVLQQSKTVNNGGIEFIATDTNKPVTLQNGEVMQLPTSKQDPVTVEQATVSNDFTAQPTKNVTVSKPQKTEQPRKQPTAQPAPSAPAPREENIPPVSDRGTAPTPQKKPIVQKDNSSSTVNASLKWGLGILASAWLGNMIFGSKKKKRK